MAGKKTKDPEYVALQTISGDGVTVLARGPKSKKSQVPMSKSKFDKTAFPDDLFTCDLELFKKLQRRGACEKHVETERTPVGADDESATMTDDNLGLGDE